MLNLVSSPATTTLWRLSGYKEYLLFILYAGELVILNKFDHAEPLCDLPQLELVLVSGPETGTASIIAMVANTMSLEPTVAVGHSCFKFC